MLTILIILVLVVGFYSGVRRGLALQLVYTGGYLLSYLAAKTFYLDLAPKLELYVPYPSATPDTKLVFFDQTITLELDQAFYAAVAFLLILFIGWLLTRFVGILVRGLMYMPILKQMNGLAGGILSFAVVYIGLFLLLSILSLIPMDMIQHQFAQSGLARFIVEHTPIFTKDIYHMWIEQMI
ncbi:colicin V production family protein [Enterococcus canis]|uniref:Colicin V production family protein n=1 Tax=Enterococcus canis TaxID=214095 RepID=A0A1L8RGP9_9ENTE|nr:CvpA family protein [Enterococcus canis]OJG18946.1 colicin V production family protein [Enterococcus canis]